MFGACGYTPRHALLIEAHRAELLAVARKRGVTGVWIFGSMSRGDSDVDLLMTLAPGTRALAALREHVLAVCVPP